MIAMPKDEEQRKYTQGVPVNCYTAVQARTILGSTQAQLQQFAYDGKIRKVENPLGKLSYYLREDVDTLAAKARLFELTHIYQFSPVSTEYRMATFDDIPGIFHVTADRWGEDHATPIPLRQSWYQANNRIDYVVVYGPLILGYINMTPYRERVLEEMMSGQKRGWDIRRTDILPFRPNTAYDCFIGINVRQSVLDSDGTEREIPFREQYAQQLILGFFRTLCQMYRQEGIVIQRLYATSDEEDGIKISRDLGFVKQPNKPTDVFHTDREPPRQFGRFILDMSTANSPVVSAYRSILSSSMKGEPLE